MSDNGKPQKTVVCGAGPVGALAAIYAAKRGDEVHIFELRDDLRKASTTPLNFTKSINLALSERGKNAILHAEVEALLQDILEDTVPMHARMIHGRRKTRAIYEESQPYDAFGRYNSAVDRAALNRRLLTALQEMPNVSMHFDHKLLGADFNKKLAWFERLRSSESVQSKSTARSAEVEVSFDFFIGADGAHSATRYHLMKFARLDYHQEYIDCLWCEFRIEPRPGSKFAIEPNHLHIWPAGSFMFIAIPSPDASFTCTLFASAEHFEHLSQDTNQRLVPFFDLHFPGVCPDLIPSIDLITQFKQNPHLPLISIKCTPYHYKSAVVILGDAAHAMVPFYGQGMNAGLEDVRVLFLLLDHHNVYSQAPSPPHQDQARAKALTAYTAQRTPNAHTVNDLALQNYREMNAHVRSPWYKLRKWLEERVSVTMPWTGWRTQYTRVSFENQPYAEVVRDVRAQGRVLVALMGSGVLGVVALVCVAAQRGGLVRRLGRG